MQTENKPRRFLWQLSFEALGNRQRVSLFAIRRQTDHPRMPSHAWAYNKRYTRMRTPPTILPQLICVRYAPRQKANWQTNTEWRQNSSVNGLTSHTWSNDSKKCTSPHTTHRCSFYLRTLRWTVDSPNHTGFKTFSWYKVRLESSPMRHRAAFCFANKGKIRNNYALSRT